jgi:hypothetical protein
VRSFHAPVKTGRRAPGIWHRPPTQTTVPHARMLQPERLVETDGAILSPLPSPDPRPPTPVPGWEVER